MNKLKWLAVIVIIGLVLNVFLLYYLLFNLRNEFRSELSNKAGQPIEQPSNSENSYLAELEKKTAETDSTCLPACLVEIEKIKEQIAKITPQVIKEVEKPVETAASTSSVPSVQEYYVFFGSGSTRSQEWIDVSGLIVEIDSTKYKNIKSTRFEASLRIPTGVGKVYARLYNDTDKHAVWFSEISIESSDAVFLQSDGINLDSGNKTYKVQMKSTIGAEALVDSARVKITIE